MAASRNQTLHPSTLGSTSIPINTAFPAASTGGQPVYIIQDAKTNDREHYKNIYSVKAVRGLAITQIVIAAVLYVPSEVIAVEHYGWSVPGAGVWRYGTGVFYGVTGAIGLYSSFKTKSSSVTFFMVMCIIAAIFAIVNVILSSIGLEHPDYGKPATTGFYGFQMILALTEMVVAITAAAICCKACCCRSNSRAGQVIYQGAGTASTPGLAIPQQHIELGGTPAAILTNGNVGRPESTPPQYEEVASSGAAPFEDVVLDNGSDSNDLVQGLGGKRTKV